MLDTRPSSQRWQPQRALDRGTGVALNRMQFKNDIVEHEACQWPRYRQGRAIQTHRLETPCRGRQRGRMAHFPPHRVQSQPNAAAGGVASRPAFARSGIRRVAIGVERMTIEKGVGKRRNDRIDAAAEEGRVAITVEAILTPMT